MDMKTLSLYNGLASRSDYGHTLGWAVLATGATVLTGMVVGRIVKGHWPGFEEGAGFLPWTSSADEETSDAGGRTNGLAATNGHAAAPTTADVDLTGLTKEQLYEQARERDIPGRSSMSKKELLDALQK